MYQQKLQRLAHRRSNQEPNEDVGTAASVYFVLLGSGTGLLISEWIWTQYFIGKPHEGALPLENNGLKVEPVDSIVPDDSAVMAKALTMFYECEEALNRWMSEGAEGFVKEHVAELDRKAEEKKEGKSATEDEGNERK